MTRIAGTFRERLAGRPDAPVRGRSALALAGGPCSVVLGVRVPGGIIAGRRLSHREHLLPI